MKKAFIYILTNSNHSVLYTGVTSNITKRIYQHKNKFCEGFTSRYNCDLLVYYEAFDDMTNAIKREKQIKAGSRKKKIDLIDSFNSEWRDLYNEVLRY